LAPNCDLEIAWWSLTHSKEKHREVLVVECYLDESGTDDLSPTAVVGGLLLRQDAFFWLDVEWRKVLLKHGINPPIHMKEFGPHGEFKDISHQARRALFTDLVRIINEHKSMSISATLTTEQYNRIFSGIFDTRKSMSVYASCFVLLAVLNGKCAEAENYKYDIPFVVDDNNPYKHHILDAHSVVKEFQKQVPLNAGQLSFATDTDLCAIQAADVVSWTVRKSIVGTFKHGFEPLPALLDEKHESQPFEEGWMIEVANALRNKYGTRPMETRRA